MPQTMSAVFGHSTPIYRFKSSICLQKDLSFLHRMIMWGPSSGSLQREHSGSVAVNHLSLLLDGRALKAPRHIMSLIFGGISFIHSCFHLKVGLARCGAHFNVGGCTGVFSGGWINSRIWFVCLFVCVFI